MARGGQQLVTAVRCQGNILNFCRTGTTQGSGQTAGAKVGLVLLFPLPEQCQALEGKSPKWGRKVCKELNLRGKIHTNQSRGRVFLCKNHHFPAV